MVSFVLARKVVVNISPISNSDAKKRSSARDEEVATKENVIAE